MARHVSVDEELLRGLAGFLGDPVITVTLPTHRFGPAVVQDRVLLSDTIDRLERSHELRAWPHADEALRRLRDEAEQVDPQHMLDAILVYASAHGSGHLAVTGTVTPRAVFGPRIALVPVVHAVRQRFPALVVAVADAGGRAWWKDGLTLTELDDDWFPFELGPDDHRHGDRWEFGRQQSTLEATHRTQLARDVDRRVSAVLDGHRLPVYLAGSSKSTASVYADSRSNGRFAALRLGIISHPTTADLVAVARQVDDDLRAQWHGQRQRNLAEAVSARRLAVDLDEITELVHDGNTSLLLLEEGLLRTVDEPRASRLDHAVAALLARGDEVDVVAPGTLGDHGPHALITRY